MKLDDRRQRVLAASPPRSEGVIPRWHIFVINGGISTGGSTLSTNVVFTSIR
jgi:hypothetical protein